MTRAPLPFEHVVTALAVDPPVERPPAIKKGFPFIRGKN